MITVTLSIQTEDGKAALATIQDHMLEVVDRLRDFQERYKDQADLPLPLEVVETQKVAGVAIKMKLTVEKTAA